METTTRRSRKWSLVQFQLNQLFMKTEVSWAIRKSSKWAKAAQGVTPKLIPDKPIKQMARRTTLALACMNSNLRVSSTKTNSLSRAWVKAAKEEELAQKQGTSTLVSPSRTKMSPRRRCPSFETKKDRMLPPKTSTSLMKMESWALILNSISKKR